jgi:thiol-disulfide isomerase/thioredoxin
MKVLSVCLLALFISSSLVAKLPIIHIKVVGGENKIISYFQDTLTPEQHFVPNYDSIASVDELLSKFKDKVIYIDMWATWCGPCKAQFEFKKDIDPFFKSKGVEVLYISLDRGNDKQKWVNMIKYYNLEGYHVLASEKLAGDIYKTFGRHNSLMIPRYVICKGGKVVLKNAKRPQDKEALFKQVESFL